MREYETTEVIVGTVTGTLEQRTSVIACHYTPTGELVIVGRTGPPTTDQARALADVLNPDRRLSLAHAHRRRPLRRHSGSTYPRLACQVGGGLPVPIRVANTKRCESSAAPATEEAAQLASQGVNVLLG